MNDLEIRRMNANLRKELAEWQKGAVGLLVLAIVVNVTLFGLCKRNHETARQWEQKYHLAVQIQQEAVEAYGALRDQVEQERTDREEAARAFETAGAYRYIGECVLTAYCCETEGNPHTCGTGSGLTATGVPVAPGMVTVDPDVIPLGSTVIIDGVEYLAADTGVRGLHVDIAMDKHSAAEAFGRQSGNVWVKTEKEGQS